MDYSERVLDIIGKIVIKIMSIGKSREYIYSINNSNFYVRNNTHDKLIIYEVFKTNTYSKPQGIIVDIGANFGSYTVWSAKNPDTKVFSFEPVKNNYKQLLKNIKLNQLKNVRPYNIAISSKRESRKIYLADTNHGAASLYVSFTKNYETIKCMTLKDIFRIIKNKHIDFLKIDAEGAEYEILFSSDKKTLTKIKRIDLEFHDYLGLKYNYRDLIKYLENNGFKVEMNSNKLFVKLFKQGIITAINENQ